MGNKSVPLFPLLSYTIKILNLLLPVTLWVGVGKMWRQPASQATQHHSLKPFLPNVFYYPFLSNYQTLMKIILCGALKAADIKQVSSMSKGILIHFQENGPLQL